MVGFGPYFILNKTARIIIKMNRAGVNINIRIFKQNNQRRAKLVSVSNMRVYCIMANPSYGILK
jgi:hypothetical protein